MRRLLILTTLVSGALVAPPVALAATAPTITAPTPTTAPSISWADSVDNIAGYDVLRANPTCADTFAPVVNGHVAPPLVPGDPLNFTDTTVTTQGNYCYLVRANDGLGTADSNQVTVTVDRTGPVISVTQTGGDGCTAFTFTPTAVDAAQPVAISANEPGTLGVYTPVGDFYAMVDPVPTITATDSLGNVSMRTVPGQRIWDQTGPGPASLEISTDPAQQQVTLNWNPVTYDGAPITYSLRTQGPQGVRVSTVVPPVVVQNLLVDASYAFTLAAVDACNRSGAASTKTVRLNDTTPPSAPIVAKPGFDPATHVVALTWIASSDNIQVDHYEILRNGVPIGATDSTSFADAFPPQASVLSYVVRAVDTNGNETEAAPATVTTPDWTPPTGPLLSQPTRVGTAVTLRWPPAADNIGVVGYDILRAESATGPQKLIASLPGTGRTYVDRNVPLGRHYWWVRARDAAGLSTPSAGQTLVVSKALLGATIVSMHSTRKGKGSERYSLGGPVRMIMDIRIVGTVTKGKLRLYVKSGRGRITVWRGTPGSSAPRVQLGSSLVRRGYVTIKLGRALHEGRIRLVLIASKRVVIAPTGAHKPKLKTA